MKEGTIIFQWLLILKITSHIFRTKIIRYKTHGEMIPTTPDYPWVVLRDRVSIPCFSCLSHLYHRAKITLVCCKRQPVGTSISHSNQQVNSSHSHQTISTTIYTSKNYLWHYVTCAVLMNHKSHQNKPSNSHITLPVLNERWCIVVYIGSCLNWRKKRNKHSSNNNRGKTIPSLFG